MLSAALLTACYDDTRVWNELDGLEGRIETLEELCTKLNTEIGEIKTIVNALNAGDYVTAVKEVTGGYQIDFKNAASITIKHGKDGATGAAGANGTNGANGADGKTPVIGVELIDSVYYWTVNGTLLKDAAGNNVAASGATGPQGPQGIQGPAGSNGSNGNNGTDGKTPELKIEDGYWYVNYGEGWVQLGAATAGSQVAGLFSEVVNGETSVKFVLAAGGEIVLPKYVEATIQLAREDFFLRYDGQKKVAFTADGLTDLYLVKPNGWKAAIVEGEIVVTAPSKTAIELGVAEAEGEIVVHGTADNGSCKVAKIAVTAGPGLTLTLDVNGNLVVENAYAGEKSSMWGDVFFGFEDFVFGIATPADFHADPKAYVEFYNTYWSAPNEMDPIFPSMYNVAYGGEYEEGVYEVDVIRTTVAEVYASYYWSEPQPGASFVLWAAPIIPGSEGQADFSNIVYADYVNVLWDVVPSAVSHSDVTISANVAGASKFVIGSVAESYYYSEWNPMTFEQYMNSAMGGPWAGFSKYGMAEALGVVVSAEDIPAEFNLSDVMGEKLSAGTNYKIWVMPLVDNLVKIDEANSYPDEGYYAYDYSAFDFNKNFMPYVFDVKTNELQPGGDHEASLVLISNDYTSINVDVTPSAATESVFYYWYSETQWSAFESDADVIAHLMENCYSPLAEAGKVSKTYVSPGETYVLATVSVGTDGKYGEVVNKSFSTLAIPSTTSITVEVLKAELDAEGKNYTVTVKVTGADKVMGYNIKDSDSNWVSFPKNVCVNGHMTSYYGYQMADVVDGQATLTFTYNQYKNGYYVAAYNVTDGAVSAICAEPARVNLF